MSKNINQIFVANPITSNAATDLMYFGQSPYGVGDDAAMTFANFSAQFGAPFTPSALTKVDDTNVTLTLGGTPNTSLLEAVSITAGWTGQLSIPRGGSGASSFTAYAVLCGGTTSTNPLQSVAGLGNAGDVLTSNGAAMLPTFQAPSGGGVTSTQVQQNAFNTGVDSGVADAYDVAVTPAITTPYNGMLLVLITANGNVTQAPTLALNGGTAYPIGVFSGAFPVQAGDISGQIPAFFIFNSLGFWQLLNPNTVGSYPKLVTQGVLTYYADQGVAADVYVATAGINSAFQYSAAPVSGTVVYLEVANTNTGASTLNFNGSGAVAIEYAGSALVGGEMLAGCISELVFSSTNKWNLINSYL